MTSIVNDWTTEELMDLIEKRFGVRFTQKHVCTIRRKLGMKYAKPYQHDYMVSRNAEDDLKNVSIISIVEQVTGFWMNPHRKPRPIL